MPVLDAAAIINAKLAEGVTVPEVLGELKDFESRELAQAMVSEGRLKVLSPSKDSVDAVRDAASPRLSETDLQVLALGFELKEEIVTDDYSLQASAKRLGLKFRPVIFEGITH
ncbi:MAG: hypothetical protein KAW41_06690 [Candidatus Diapherotrites archaeon]|nr:hypothetical protein [Candidatus Diapherotrites archaeon]